MTKDISIASRDYRFAHTSATVLRMNWIFGAVEELLPVIVFFVVQSWIDFQAGLLAMTGTLIVLLLYALVTKQQAPRFALVSTLAFLLFAIPSLITGDSAYFQLSDTVVDGMFALLLLGSWCIKYPLLKVLFGSIFAITDKAWHILALRWGILFLCLAIANESIRVLYSEDIWSWYKLLSTIGILLFGTFQFTLSAKERLPNKSNRLGLRM